jgi:hypothetical protein
MRMGDVAVELHPGDAAADEVVALRPARQQGAVGVEECDAVVRTDGEGAEHLLEIGEPQASDDDAGERSVRMRESPAQGQHRQAGRLRDHRAADVKRGRVALAVKLEIVAVGAVRRLRIGVARVEAEMSALVDDEHAVELSGGRRPVEQQELAQLRRHLCELGAADILDDGLQRQVEALDVEEDVEFERRDEARCGITCTVPGGAAGIDEQYRTDRGEARGEGEQGRDHAVGGAARRELAVRVVQFRSLQFRGLQFRSLHFQAPVRGLVSQLSV